MRSLAVSAILLGLIASAPAEAQIAGPFPRGDVRPPNPFLSDSRLPGPGIGRDLGDIHDRAERARDSGALSKRQARRLKREARRTGRLAEIYGSDGLSASERAELEARAQYLRGAVNAPLAGAGRNEGRAKRR
ncbi:MAG TPA: hypothetical protein VF662_10860 [Allosphingosinicella sp.]|jgi:hypothetical protein